MGQGITAQFDLVLVESGIKFQVQDKDLATHHIVELDLNVFLLIQIKSQMHLI